MGEPRPADPHQVFQRQPQRKVEPRLSTQDAMGTTEGRGDVRMDAAFASADRKAEVRTCLKGRLKGSGIVFDRSCLVDFPTQTVFFRVHAY
jgi:hypothetical protein